MTRLSVMGLNFPGGTELDSTHSSGKQGPVLTSWSKATTREADAPEGCLGRDEWIQVKE